MTPQNALIDLVETTKTAVMGYAQTPAVQEALEAPLEDWTPPVEVLRYRIEALRVLMFSMGYTLSQVPGDGVAYGGPLLGMVAAFSAAIHSETDPKRALTLFEMWLNAALHDLSPEWYAHITDETPLSDEELLALMQTLSPLEVMTFMAACDTRKRVLEVLHDREWDSDEVLETWMEELPFERPNGLKA